MKKTRNRVLSAVFAVILAGTCLMTGCGNDKKTSDDSKDTKKEATGWDKADEIIDNIKKNAPEFDDYEVKITDFGAEVKTEKITDKEQEKILAKSNTLAISRAIEEVSKHKGKDGKVGGTVTIPSGYTYTGAIHLWDNVRLNVPEGSFVMFTTDYSQYPNVLTRWEGVELYNYSPMIYAYKKKNIAITGKGVLDAQATKEQYWLPWKNKNFLPEQTQDNDRKALFQMGAEGVAVDQRQFGEGHYLRPAFLQTFDCEKVLIEGITINNAPFWMVHPVLTKNITIKDILLESHGYNNDGVDPDSCSNVLVENCTFKTGDDCVAIKSGRNEDGRAVGVPSENIVVQNNTYVTGKGACATVGSEMSGDIRNIYFRDNKSEDTVEHLQAISLKTNGDRGGVIENIYMKGIQANNTEDRAVLITMFYEEADTQKTTPAIKNIFLEDCTFKCKKPENEKDVISIWGYNRSMIENVTFKNCSFEGCDNFLNIHNVKGLKFEGVTLNGQKYKDGELDPAKDSKVFNCEVKKNISLTYSCGANEENLKPGFLVSDSETGEFVPVANTDALEKSFINLTSNGAEAKLMNIDANKFYKFTMTIDGTVWTSDVLKNSK